MTYAEPIVAPGPVSGFARTNASAVMPGRTMVYGAEALEALNQFQPA